MSDLWTWGLGVFVVAVVAGTLWVQFRRTTTTNTEDTYLHALEAWIAGDLELATRLLHEVVHTDPDSVDPFLQLGNLLRLQGDPGKAAILHRGLAVRPNLSRGRKVVIGLALAADLNALERWDEAGQVLDTLIRDASDKSRYWRARFLQRYGQGDLPEAARTLRNAPKHCPEKDRQWFSEAYAAFQLDRALQHVRQGEYAEARNRVGDVAKLPSAGARPALIKALIAAARGDVSESLKVASESLLDSPVEMDVFLPALQDVLLQAGQYARSIPILEQACQSDKAPPTLWISLAMLYEKLGHRDKVLRLMDAKAGSPGLTPDVAAPLLRLLADEYSNADFSRVWSKLVMPAKPTTWTCCNCGHRQDTLGWFCRACYSFDTFNPGCRTQEVQ